MIDKGNDKKSAVQAKFDAQKIAFAPIMFQAARALCSLGILSLIHDNRNSGLTLAEISEKTKIPIYGIKVLIEAGLSLEVLMLKNDKLFITKTGWFLLNDPLTKVNMDFTHDVNYEGFFRLEESIRTGKPEGLKVFGKWNTVYEALSSLPEHVQKSWFAFDHYSSDAAFPEVVKYLLKSNPQRILDIGGNTGKFSIFCALNNPDVKLTILDLPGQLEKARKNINDLGLSERIDTLAINLLDHTIEYPKNYDIAWMSQFLDCFSKNDIIELLKKAKKSLSDKGSIFILETLWDRQKYDAATYSLHATSLYFTCIANGCSQMYHSEDMHQMISEAGLKLEKEWDNIGIGHTLLKCTAE